MALIFFSLVFSGDANQRAAKKKPNHSTQWLKQQQHQRITACVILNVECKIHWKFVIGSSDLSRN